MIATVDDIKILRGVGLNVDPEKLLPYCEEAEKHDVLPVITAKIYRDIEASRTDPKWDILLNGGYYGEDPNLCHIRGLKMAIGYIAYSRALMTGDITVTNFGPVRKYSQNSEAIDEVTRIRAANETRKLGDECLRQCKEYILRYCCGGVSGVDSITRRKYIKVKKRKV